MVGNVGEDANSAQKTTATTIAVQHSHLVSKPARKRRKRRQRTESGNGRVKRNMKELQDAGPALQHEGPVPAEGVHEHLNGRRPQVREMRVESNRVRFR